MAINKKKKAAKKKPVAKKAPAKKAPVKKKVAKNSTTNRASQKKTVSKKAPAKKKVVKATAVQQAKKREVGKTLSLSINATWVHLFQTNAKVKKVDRLTNQQMLDFMVKEFPAKKDTTNSTLRGVVVYRSMFNAGRLTGGEAPAKRSVQYDEEGNIKQGRGLKKPTTDAKPKPVANKKAPAKKKVAAKKKEPAKAKTPAKPKPAAKKKAVKKKVVRKKAVKK